MQEKFTFKLISNPLRVSGKPFSGATWCSGLDLALEADKPSG